MRLKIILGSALAIAILVVGCGGGGGSSSGTSAGGTGGTTTNASSDGGGKPLSKKQFIAKGDAICVKVPPSYNSKLQELEKEAKKPLSPAEKNLKAAVPPLYVAVEELGGLTPPKGDEQKAEAITGALEAAAKGVEEKPTSELSGPKSPFAEFQKLTGEYGFAGCSQL
ncbi:MAG: hypothetical protein QOE56_590 [Solirubrobacterales bacterium]|jgi:hypothetical protein|nr:hypothetical protein [Solirubrobacterales bacterium]